MSDVEVEDLRMRLSYMGRILRHTFPELEFDIESLRCKAESLTEAEAPSHGFAEGADSDIEGDLNIDDENCTINAVDDTIARRYGTRWATHPADIPNRLLGRVLLLELFYANQTTRERVDDVVAYYCMSFVIISELTLVDM